MTDKIRILQEQLGTIIKGKKEVTDKIIMAVLAKGHVLLEDDHSPCTEQADGHGFSTYPVYTGRGSL